MRKASREQASPGPEEELRVTLMSIGDAVIATDAAGHVTRLNPVAETLTGWPGVEAAGRPLEEVLVIINEKTRQPAENPVQRVIREGIVVGLANHTLLLSRDGREIPIDDSAAPIRSGEGSIVGVVMVFRDITDRRAREREESDRVDAQRARVLARAETLARMGSWRWEPAGNVLVWSAELCRIFGLPEGTALSPEKFSDLIHPDDRDRVTALIATATERGAPFHYRGKIRRPDGTERILDSQGDVERDRDGAVVSLFGFSRDVTEEVHAENERRLAEDALREQQELYEKLVGAQSDIGDGVCLVEGARLVYVNDALARMYGYTPAELRDMPSFMDVVEPEERDRLAVTLRRRLGGERFDALGETQIIRKDGRRIIIEYGVKPVQIRGKTLLIAIIRDVTERRREAEALKEQQELYEKLLGAQSDVGDGVTITEGTRLIYVNDALARMYGYTVDELMAMPDLMELIVPEDRGRLLNKLRRRLEGEQVGDLGETEVIRKDGRRLVNEYAVKPVQVRGRTLVVSIVRDVTERRRAEESIRQLSHRLLQLQDEEQERIARDLQSTVGRTLEVIRARLSTVRDSGTLFDWVTSEALRESLALVQDAATEVKTLSRLLYPPLLDDAGLSEAIRWYVFDYTQMTKIKVALDVPVRFRRLARDAERALFRVAQESLANVARHSGQQHRRDPPARGRVRNGLPGNRGQGAGHPAGNPSGFSRDRGHLRRGNTRYGGKGAPARRKTGNRFGCHRHHCQGDPAVVTKGRGRDVPRPPPFLSPACTRP